MSESQKQRSKEMKVLKVYREAFYNERRYLVLRGGANSGKSHFATQKFLLRTFIKGHRLLVMRKKHNRVGESVYKLFTRIICELDLQDLFEFRTSPFKITNLETGSEIIFQGLDDPNKIKSISGVTSIWLEEADQFTFDDFNQIDLRLRDITPDYRQIMLTFNPIGTSSWIYKHFFNEATDYTKDNTFYLKTTYLDNNTTGEAYKKKLHSLKQQNEAYYNVYCLGEWGTLKEAVFKPFERFKDRPTNIKETFYGMDFGINDPSVLIRVDVADSICYVTEMLFETNILSVDLPKRLNALGIEKNKIIYCDSAGLDSIKQLKRAGFLATKSDKSRIDGINWIKANQYRILIEEGSSNLIEELENYCYKKTREGKILEDPISFNDHGIDAMRYAFYSEFAQRDFNAFAGLVKNRK